MPAPGCGPARRRSSPTSAFRCRGSPSASIATKRDIAASGLIAPIVGHVGDGNFHTLILVDPDAPDEIARAQALHERMVARALDLDGTSTGEHGIGTGKIEFLERELGEAVDVMRAIKRALDPNGIMNPGKIFRQCSASG